MWFHFDSYMIFIVFVWILKDGWLQWFLNVFNRDRTFDSCQLLGHLWGLSASRETRVGRFYFCPESYTSTLHLFWEPRAYTHQFVILAVLLPPLCWPLRGNSWAGWFSVA